jgi:hypothetical protein
MMLVVAAVVVVVVVLLSGNISITYLWGKKGVRSSNIGIFMSQQPTNAKRACCCTQLNDHIPRDKAVDTVDGCEILHHQTDETL